MSEDAADQADKPFDASPRKLEEARKKGEIARSQEANTFVALTLMLLSVIGFANYFVADLLTGLIQSTIASVSLDSSFSFESLQPAMARLLGVSVLALYALTFIGFALYIIASRQIIFSTSKIQPNWKHISVTENIKKKFGIRAMVEFLRNLIKVSLFAVVLYFFFSEDLITPYASISGNPSIGGIEIFRSCILLATYTLAIYFAISAFDIIWQYRQHAQKNRMSHQEMKEEVKNEEGDEMLRQQRKARAEEIATNRMLLDVPKATVVVTNPTHFAVALRWDGHSNEVPKCVARGTDETARRIRELAIKSGVPLYRDPPTARALYAKVKVGGFIEEDHFKAVAAAVSYARRIEAMLDT